MVDMSTLDYRKKCRLPQSSASIPPQNYKSLTPA